jgi:hypothetical protein
MYRTTEGSLGPRTGRAEYGPWRVAGVVGVNDTFSLSLPACSPQVRLTGCVGGAYELYATYRSQPCTEMWYASLTAGEPDYLPENAFVCNKTSNSIASLTGEKYFEPLCTPSWVRNCLPGTVGNTSASGLIDRPTTNVGSFSFSHVTIAYRTVEGSADGSVYGSIHYMKVGAHGRFSLALRGCGVFAPNPSCDGGVVEAWPAYEHVRCGETPTPRVLVAGEPQQWGKSVCDTRSVVEGNLKARKVTAWTVVVRGDGNFTTAVKPNGTFSLLLPPGRYQVTARNGRKQCATTRRVKLGIAKTIHLAMRC